MTARGLTLGMLLLVSATTAAAQGRIANSKMATRQFSGSVESELQSQGTRGGPFWLGYRTPMVPGRRQMCCVDTMPAGGDCCGACRLESNGGVTMTAGNLDARGSRIVLEPPGDVVILARVEAGAVSRLRTFTPDCDIDAGGMSVVWLENVPPAASIAWLSSVIRPGGDRERENRVVRPAIGALALHPDRSALTALIALARQDSRVEVRNQALFWLSQRAGQEAAATITDALLNDPDTEVKRRAVFALSQLPKDEGVPLLIQVARSNRNPEVRKRAMFWLGESRDPRAVSFFEEILKVR